MDTRRADTRRGSEGRMTHISIDEAGAQLPRLIRDANSGEEIIITDGSEPVAKLVPLHRKQAHPKRGSAKGLILHMSDDFDEPRPDFAEYQ